jgi:hypothetical protein
LFGQFRLRFRAEVGNHQQAVLQGDDLQVFGNIDQVVAQALGFAEAFVTSGH